LSESAIHASYASRVLPYEAIALYNKRESIVQA
jgi:hypothetical protein